LGDCWQAQTRAALSQIERLKEMLSEGASWTQATASEYPAPAAHAPQNSSGVDPKNNGAGPAEDTKNMIDTNQPAGAAGGTEEGGSLAGAAERLHGGGEKASQREEAAEDICGQCRTKDQQLMEQRAHIADLDLQLRTMRADTLRSTQLASQVGRVMLPALYSIESRLTDAVSDR
jgi:Tfp pilus assembly protein FimV